jgi:hypothetical protein
MTNNRISTNLTLETVQIEIQGDRKVIFLPENYQFPDTEFYLRLIGDTIVLLPIHSLYDPCLGLFADDADTLEQITNEAYQNRQSVINGDRKLYLDLPPEAYNTFF